MITINNKEYRNIVEQVEKNKEDIARHYAIDRVIAEVGIKVMGQLENPPADDQLPPGGADAFGEAYLVGSAEPYDIHIWTRPGEWFNIGALNMIGDQGVPGDSIENAEVTTDNRLKLTMSDGREVITKTAFTTIKGDTGETGPKNSIIGFTIDPVTYRATLTFEDGSTATSNLSIRGVQGPQGVGIEGKKGDPGRSVYIKGIVETITELNTINPLDDLFGAYLVGTTSPYLLYVPVQEIGKFIYMGQFMGGTIITVNNETQDTWNADTKLDKYTTSGGGNKVYGVNNDGEQKMYTVRNDPQTGNSGVYKNQIVQYDVANNKNTGLIRIAETPTQTYHTASKKYVDDKVLNDKVLQSCIASWDGECQISFYRSVSRSNAYGTYDETFSYDWQACNGITHPNGYNIFAFQNQGFVSEDSDFVTVIRCFNRATSEIEERVIYGQPSNFETATLN